MADVAAIARSAVAALRLGPDRWAVAAAARAVASAGVIAVLGVATGNLAAVGLAYLGAACSVLFAIGGVYRVRTVGLLVQAAGAMLGIAVGATLPSGPASLIVAATVAGVISGMVGVVGVAAPGFGIMLSIGLAFGQFGGSSLTWWQQSLWYLVGTAVVATATVAPWLSRRGGLERDAAAAVFAASADLCASTGTEAAAAMRVRLASASAVARSGTRHPRAELVALAAAALYVEGRPVPDELITAMRTAGSQVCSDAPVSVHVTATGDTPGQAALIDALVSEVADPPPDRPDRKRRVRGALRTLRSRTAMTNGLRIGLCLGVATAIAVAVHEPTHAFWLPLTVAVIVRPEYASVFVRTVNRLAGTLIGACVAGIVVAIHPTGFPVALAAAAAIGFAVLAAPKLYGLSVIGITASTLLSSSIGSADPVLPGVRILDTMVGATVAIVFGYLLWPGARRMPESADVAAAVTAARRYLDEAVKPPVSREQWAARRDDAYRLAHRARAATQAALCEPPPVTAVAATVLPLAVAVEDVVDAITAVAVVTDDGADATAMADDLARRLDRLAAETAGLDSPPR